MDKMSHNSNFSRYPYVPGQRRAVLDMHCSGTRKGDDGRKTTEIGSKVCHFPQNDNWSLLQHIIENGVLTPNITMFSSYKYI